MATPHTLLLLVLLFGCNTPALGRSELDSGSVDQAAPPGSFRLLVLDRYPPASVPAAGTQPIADDCTHTLLLAERPSISSATANARRAYWPLVHSAECRYGIPPGLLDSVILQESRYSPLAVSRAGAVGLAQLMPATARALGVVDRTDPHGSIEGGARYLRQMLDRFRSVPLDIAAYNAGPAAVEHARGIPLNGETPLYVQRVMAYLIEHISSSHAALRRVALSGF